MLVYPSPWPSTSSGGEVYKLDSGLHDTLFYQLRNATLFSHLKHVFQVFMFEADQRPILQSNLKEETKTRGLPYPKTLDPCQTLLNI